MDLGYFRVALAGLSLSCSALGCTPEPQSTSGAGLEAACARSLEALGPDDWICDESRTVECEARYTEVDTQLHYVADGDCPAELKIDDPGPYEVGTHLISLYDPDSTTGEALCTSKLIVIDEQPPRGRDAELSLWPPNHKLHRIEAEDCVVIEDNCDRDVEVHFQWASSDESENARGDGNTEQDIVNLDCDSVQLRAERAGPNNGRVYKLGWIAKDEHGNQTEGVCTVVVPHDRSGRSAVDDGEAHRVELPEGRCD